MALRLAVRLTPRGGRDRIDGWGLDDAGRSFLKVRVSAPPVDGEANVALEALIAKTLKVSRGAVRIISGETARVKQVEIEGVEAADLVRAFGAPPEG